MKVTFTFLHNTSEVDVEIIAEWNGSQILGKNG